MTDPSSAPTLAPDPQVPTPLPQSAEERGVNCRAFLSKAGWGEAALLPLAGDASPRRYHRLRLGGASAVLMECDPARIDPVPFLRVTAWLREQGLSAPEVLDADPAAGLILLEDLGDDLFARLLARDPEPESRLYATAIDLLAALRGMPLPAAAPDWRPRAYDLAILMAEARLAVEWYLPAASGAPVPAEVSEAFDALFAPLLAPLLPEAPVPVLRDYHAENLVWLPARSGLACIGLLDYQDLLLGHPAYDVVSLLEDARRDTAPLLRAAMTARYCAATGAEPDDFSRAAHILAAQRNLKILGIFARLCRRDGRPGYLRHMPRVWDHLWRDLDHPALAPLRTWCAGLPAPTPETLARIEHGGSGAGSDRRGRP